MILNISDRTLSSNSLGSALKAPRKKSDFEFEVRDRGIGVAKGSIQKLTKPFFQANQNVSTKGFGLGLTICKKIIESHKGRISIESKEGKGSNIILYLPST